MMKLCGFTAIEKLPKNGWMVVYVNDRVLKAQKNLKFHLGLVLTFFLGLVSARAPSVRGELVLCYAGLLRGGAAS